jgi:hypothetical protein
MAPQYRQTSPAKNSLLLDEFNATTGYNRKYAMWLLNYAEEVQQNFGRLRQNSDQGLVWETWPNET